MSGQDMSGQDMSGQDMSGQDMSGQDTDVTMRRGIKKLKWFGRV